MGAAIAMAAWTSDSVCWFWGLKPALVETHPLRCSARGSLSTACRRKASRMRRLMVQILWQPLLRLLALPLLLGRRTRHHAWSKFRCHCLGGRLTDMWDRQPEGHAGLWPGTGPEGSDLDEKWCLRLEIWRMETMRGPELVPAHRLGLTEISFAAKFRARSPGTNFGAATPSAWAPGVPEFRRAVASNIVFEAEPPPLLVQRPVDPCHMLFRQSAECLPPQSSPLGAYNAYNLAANLRRTPPHMGPDFATHHLPEQGPDCMMHAACRATPSGRGTRSQLIR